MREKEKNRIWEKLMGYVEENGEVENLFAEGKECARLWQEIYQYEMCIIEKLDGEDCEELEKMWSCYHRICQLVSFRMFDYGMNCTEK